MRFRIALVSTALSQPSVADIIGMDIRAITTVGCTCFRCINTVFQSAEISSFSIAVLICIERFVAAWYMYPLRARYLLSRNIVFRCLWMNVAAIVIMYVSMSVIYSEIADGKCDTNIAGKIYSSVLKRTPNTTFYTTMLGLQLLIFLAHLSRRLTR